MKCNFCEKDGSINYEKNDQFFFLCKSCYNRNIVQDAYEDSLLEIGLLTRSGKFDQVIDLLHEIYFKNKNYDSDKWLYFSIRSHIALIYYQSKKYQESLRMYRDLKSELEHSNTIDFLLNQQAIGNVLIKQEKWGVAKQELEFAFEKHRIEKSSTVFLNILKTYVDVLKQLELPFPEKYQIIIQKTIMFFGFDKKLFDSQLENPTGTIFTMNKVNIKSQKLFSRLNEELFANRENLSEQLLIIDKYLTYKLPRLYKNQLEYKRSEIKKKVKS